MEQSALANTSDITRFQLEFTDKRVRNTPFTNHTTAHGAPWAKYSEHSLRLCYGLQNFTTLPFTEELRNSLIMEKTWVWMSPLGGILEKPAVQHLEALRKLCLYPVPSAERRMSPQFQKL